MSKPRYPHDPICGHPLRSGEEYEHHMGYWLCRPCAKELHKSMLEYDLAETSRRLKELGE